MRKYILFTILLVSLLLSFSIGVAALGEDYLFSEMYWRTVFQNTTTRFSRYSTTDYIRPSLTDTRLFALLNGGVYGAEGDGEPTPLIVSPVDGYDITGGSIFLPVDLDVLPNQTLGLTFFVVYEQSYPLPMTQEPFFSLTSNDNSDVSFDVSISSYNGDSNLIYLGTWNSSVGGFQESYGGYGYVINCSWTNNTTSTEHINSLIFYQRYYDQIGLYNRNPSFYFGVSVSNNAAVVLPSYVETNLINIGNLLKLNNDKFDVLLSDVDSLLDLIDWIYNDLQLSTSYTIDTYGKVVELLEAVNTVAESLSYNGMHTSNIHRYLSEPDELQEATIQEIKDLLIEAKSELSEMKETIDSVVVPQLKDINDVNQDINVKIDEALASPELNTVLGSIFEQGTVITMLLMVISTCTIGYVLFGKKD